MAIKRNKKEEKVQFPSTLDNLLRRAFTETVKAKFYDTSFKDTKSEIMSYFENNDDGFEVGVGAGESIKHDCGSVQITQRSNYSFNKDEIIRMLEEGEINIVSFMEAVSFNAEKLKTVLGEAKFDEVAEKSYTESLTVKPSASFKAEVQGQLEDGEEVEVEAVVEKKAPAKKAEPKKKAPAKKAPAKAPSKNVSEELDEIIAG